MSESNRTQVIYIPEVTYGTTPVDSALWKYLLINSESLNVGPSTVQSQRIRGTNRMPADLKKTNVNVGGSVGFEFSVADFDDFLAAAMMSPWSTNVLTAGVDASVNQFTLQKQFTDLTSKYIYLKGCRVNKLDLSFAIDEIITGSIEFQGQNGAPAATSLVGTGSVVALTNNDVLAGNTDTSSILYDGTSIATSGIVITKINLSIDNGLRANKSLTSQTPVNQAAGSHKITGSIEAYVANESWEIYQDMVNNTEVSLAWTVTSGAKSYTFNLPKIKVTGQAPGASGIDTDNMVKADFVAIKNSPTITRVP